MFIYGPGTRVSVVGQIRSTLSLLGGYGFYLIFILYLMGSHHSHYLGSGELRRVQSDALCSYMDRVPVCMLWVGFVPRCLF